MSDERPVRTEFASFALNERGLSKMNALRQVFSRALDDIDAICAPGREMAIVRTKLQEASFMAVRAVSVDPENQK